MPWLPGRFGARGLGRLEREGRHTPPAAVPYFEGLLSGDLDALVQSFAGEPEVHHPVRGRIKGTRAFETLVAETRTWHAERNASVEDSRTWFRTGTASRARPSQRPRVGDGGPRARAQPPLRSCCPPSMSKVAPVTA